MELLIGPLLERNGGYSYDTFTRAEGLRRSFRYPRIDAAMAAWPDMQRFLMQGMHESDPVKRGAIYKQAQQILAEDSPLIWLVDVQFVSVFNRKLHDHTTGPLGTYQAFDQAWLEK